MPQRAHLHDLAAPATTRRAAAADVPQRADPGLLRVMGALDHVPVLLLGRRSTVLARNALLRGVLGHPMEPGTSFARFLLLAPEARRRILNWADFAQAMVAGMRREAGRFPHDRRLHRDIDELRRADPEVARWWNDHAVRDYASAVKRIRHPIAGDLVFGVELVAAPQQPDQHLIIYTAEPGSATARNLPLLASWESPVRDGA